VLDALLLDLHLRTNDTCAKDAGVTLTGITSTDIDGDARPQGAGWDIGADEVGGAPAPTPTPGRTPTPTAVTGTPAAVPSPPTLLEVVPLPS
jgi:hypothetical protein